MEIKINSLDNIKDAAREFIAAMGDNTVFAFYGKMGAGKTSIFDAISIELKVSGGWESLVINLDDSGSKRKVNDKIILEIKSASIIPEISIAQAINYLKVSQNKLAIIVNFGEVKLNYKRIVL